MCSWRTTTSRPRCPYPQAVEEAICFGWIDSTNTVFDEERNLQLFTPRRRKSSWTRLNRERAADMEARGLMTAAGRGGHCCREIHWLVDDFSTKSKTSRNHLTCRRRWTWTRQREATGTVFRPAPANRCSVVDRQCRSRRNTGRSNRPYCQQCGHRSTCPRLIRDSTASGYEGRSLSVRRISLGPKQVHPPRRSGTGGLGTRRSDLRQDADHTS